MRFVPLATATLGVLMLCTPSFAATKLSDGDVKSKFSTVAGLMNDKCLACHTKGYELPFYARIPGIKEMIEKDYRDGLRALDLNVEMLGKRDKPVSETVLAKMEWVVNNDTMPPAKFVIVHPSTKLSDADKKAILTWTATSRKGHYATDAAPKYANEPVQPLPLKVEYNKAKSNIGKKLFDDKRLSTDSTLACEGCHLRAKAGTDNLQFAKGVRDQFGDVNAPTTYNAVFNLAQFWDGRAADLQAQAGGPPLNPIEMGSKDWNEIIDRLSKDEALTAEMKAVYPGGWSAENITNAIAEYEKTLITPNSRFDKWLRGDASALKANEVQGYEKFKAYRCASCHVGKTLGGQSYEYMDLKKDYFADRGNMSFGSDKGRFNETKKEEDLHRFKVPNLRNIELTHPYMHDGLTQTLDEAVRIMGIYCAGVPVVDSDRALIVAFLRTLTGEFNGKRLDGTPVSK